MIALLLAEQNRLLSRRITRIFPLVLAVLMIMGFVGAWLVIRAVLEDGDLNFVPDLLGGTDEGFTRVGPDGETPVERGTAIMGPLGFLLPVMAFVIGASYYGADERAGMIEHLLTWEPRRTRFLLARSVAGITSMFGIAAILAIFWMALLWVLSALTGTTEGMTGELWGNLAMTVLRAGVVAGLFFLIGFGFTVLSNSSVGSIVGFLIYVLIVESTFLNLFLPNVVAWLPMANTTSFTNGSEYVAPASVLAGEPYYGSIHHGYIQSGLVIIAWTALFWVLGLVRFHFRDVD